MTRVEGRGGFAILLEEPPSTKSLWAALVTTEALIAKQPHDGVQVCISCTREGALSDARAFIDRASECQSALGIEESDDHVAQ
jgi:hypothetical protein